MRSSGQRAKLLDNTTVTVAYCIALVVAYIFQQRIAGRCTLRPMSFCTEDSEFKPNRTFNLDGICLLFRDVSALDSVVHSIEARVDWV